MSDTPSFVHVPYDPLRDIDPYCVMDGKWGGWGPASWFRFEWSGTRVFERSRRNGEPYWQKVWDVELKQWRAITLEELAQLPRLESDGPPPKVGKWIFPVVTRTPEEHDLLRSLLQPPSLCPTPPTPPTSSTSP